MKVLKPNISILTLLLLTGCVPSVPPLSNNASNVNHQTQALSFETNQVHFINTLKAQNTQKERNDFMEEYILKSDIQCQNYLSNPLQKTETTTNKDSLYMNIFDTVSSLFGISLVTNTAKAIFSGNDVASQEEKQAYANALTPEIRKGVELGRSRYAQNMIQKKPLDLNAYPIENLQSDILKYDKQCNDAYGLIEINRALKEMQNSVNAPRTASTLNIDPTAIKDKVVSVTKEVEEKKIEKEQIDENSAKVVPTQPTPVDAP
ncbi:MAG: Unknown protein [uncultured Sulfurovum sp.]|uniref:Lipoprotein n=1 Tax=uncultured Sulfurovum sp. TaxID=269237 RepID=A0A6S6TK61_9BACT|nr:MAG: Unknown protein [uncultured Sulfurovum sp.]